MIDALPPFWNWFVIICTVLGLLGCLWLVIGNSGGSKSEGKETVGHVWDEDLEEYNNPLPRWWLNLFYITLVAAAIYLLLFPGLGNFKGLLGWTQLGRYQKELDVAEATYGPRFAAFAKMDAASLAADNNAMATGQRLFSTYCSTCHGSDARGARGFPNLRDSDWLYGGEPETIKKSIMKGRNGVMPGWAAPLGEDTDAVVDFVLSLSDSKHDSTQVEQGKARYLQLCVACHGPTGDGNPALGAPRLNDKIWLYGGDRATVRESITVGRSGHMPPHGDFLGADKVHLLAAYVFGLANQDGAKTK